MGNQSTVGRAAVGSKFTPKGPHFVWQSEVTEVQAAFALPGLSLSPKYDPSKRVS